MIRLEAPAAGADAVAAVVVGLATVTVEPCTAVGACIVVQESLTDTSCNKSPVKGAAPQDPLGSICSYQKSESPACYSARIGCAGMQYCKVFLARVFLALCKSCQP